MIWLTWRQFRPQAIVSLAVLATFAILLGATGPHLASLYAGSGLASCHGTACTRPAKNFLDLLSGGYTAVFVARVNRPARASRWVASSGGDSTSNSTSSMPTTSATNA
jgi:hypothetical protein